MVSMNYDFYLAECENCGTNNRIRADIPISKTRCGRCGRNLESPSFWERIKQGEYTGPIIVILLVVAVFGYATINTLVSNYKSEDFYRSHQELSLPRSGLMSTYFTRTDAVAPLEIITRPGSKDNFYIKLYNYRTNRLAATAFIRAGGKVEFEVPLGSYEFRYATGESWFGPSLCFGPETDYFRANEVFTFSRSGDIIHGWTVELYEQVGGNLKTEGISDSEF